MRTQVALITFAMATVAAFGLFVSSAANAEQSAFSPFALLAGSAQTSMTPFALVKGGGGGGGHHGGGHHGGGHHGGWHGRGFYGGYYPYYGSYGGYYSTSPNCVWNGYKFVCYDSSSDFYDTY